MRILSLLFTLILIFSISSYAQSQEKGCSAEKSCVVKTCEDEGTEVKAQAKGETSQQTTVTRQNKKEESGQQVEGTKPTTSKKTTKKKS
jgi:hypothetical protein